MHPHGKRRGLAAILLFLRGEEIHAFNYTQPCYVSLFLPSRRKATPVSLHTVHSSIITAPSFL